MVGVRLERKQYEWGAGLLEYRAIGTAIREADVRPGDLNNGLPFVSNLSGQEFWLLRQSGWRPASFAPGNCTYYQVAGGRAQNAMISRQNVEIVDFTRALYKARSLAMSRMEHEANTVDATGVVGADIEVDAQRCEPGSHRHNRTSMLSHDTMLFHYTATGTAIAPCAAAGPSSLS